MRIWATGIGIVSPLGLSAPETMDRLLRGERGIGPLTLFEMPGARSQIAAEVRGLPGADEPLAGGEPLSRTDQMAVLAAREALGNAGLTGTSLPLDLVFGGTTSGLFETEALLAEMAGDPGALVPLRQMLSHPLSATVDRLRLAVAPFRRARTVCSACSGGANALLLAAAWLRTGRSERVLCGGADGLSRLTFAGFHSLGALSPEPCRPFDRERKGLTLGEGAAFLLLETERAAAARGAGPLCELRGWAVGSERHHITNPEPTGETAARLMRQALRCAELEPGEIDYVNAHGTATPHNDEMEAHALELCFGPAVSRIPVSSCKGQIGHTLGAAGALEAAITALAIVRGALPPTMGLREVDPACARLRHVRASEPSPLRAALSSSFGFGGTDTVLVLTAPGGFPPPRAPRPRRVLVTAAGTVGPLGVRANGEVVAYLEPGEPPAAGHVSFAAAEHLDVERARRIDRPGRLATAAIQAALRAAGAPPLDARQGLGAGAIVGSAYGPVDGSAAYVHRIFARGIKGAVPAAFPNLVPSSPVAHAAIYLGLGGPVLATSDLAATAEGAMVTAAELIAAGEAELLCAGSVEELSPIAERVLGPLCTGEPARGPRSEGAAVVLLESCSSLRARAERSGTTPRPLAVLDWLRDWRGQPEQPLDGLPAPADCGRAQVLIGSDSELARTMLRRAGWGEVPCRALAPRTGIHEGAGGFAAAAAVGELGLGRADTVLVLGLARDRGYALLLRAADASAASEEL